MIAALTHPTIPLSQPGSIADALLKARQTGQPTFHSQIERLPMAPDPLAFLEASSQALGRGTLWVAPHGATAFAGAGAVVEIHGQGPGRFSAAAAALRDLRQRLLRSETEAVFPVLGGFAFSDHAPDAPPWSDFPAALLIVPRTLLQCDGSETVLRTTIRVEPTASLAACERETQELAHRARQWAGHSLHPHAPPSVSTRRSLPDRGVWESSVATAVAVIRQRMLDKVVLAREERLLADAPYSPTTTLARLRAADASATLFAMQSGSSWFLGASPERLVRLAGERVDVSCLAGSIGVGVSTHDRRRLAQELLASGKDREEHEIVVQSVTAALSDICENVVRLSATPRVVAARTVQHLETPITASLPAAGQVLDLVERLHPTPAVGGFPRDSALHLIRELEEIERGWYAGPFGWTDLDGSGEFAVAIRSAVVSGRLASLFAGSGIVSDSVPAQEFEETRLKLRPMLAALGAE